MLVIKSDDVTEREVGLIRQQFQASINGASAAFRMPVFGVPEKSDINWMPIDAGSRDMEFQYLSDSNARTILSAFQISPEEIPGLAHLSRGSSAQDTSESNGEYMLTAHRDVGLRPLVNIFETFLNEQILPLLDEEVARYCTVKLLGLEADTAEKESVRFQTDGPIHMEYDEILQRVEKPTVGKEWGGKFPLNPQWQSIIDKYLYVDEIRTHFFGLPPDPNFHYVRDPYNFQFLQFNFQKQQMEMQMKMQEQAMAEQGAQAPSSPAGGSMSPTPPGEEGVNAQNLPKTKDPNYVNAQNEKPNMAVNATEGQLSEAAGKAGEAFGAKP